MAHEIPLLGDFVYSIRVPKPPDEFTMSMNSIRDLIADDGYAMSFQSMGQYRTALLKALDSGEAPSDKEIDKVFENNCYTDDYGTYLMQKEDFRDGVRVALSRWGSTAAPLAQVTEEVGELMVELIHVANALADEGLTGSAEPCRRAATMLQQLSAPATVVVPVNERPWERPGWRDAEGRCWCFAFYGRVRSWTLRIVEPGVYDTHCLPHYAIPLPHAGEGVG